MFRVRSDSTERFRGGPKEDLIDDLLVLQSHLLQMMRKSEDHVEILHGQELHSSCLEPFCPRLALALGAVTVSAGVV
jgi:hypothetical protein